MNKETVAQKIRLVIQNQLPSTHSKAWAQTQDFDSQNKQMPCVLDPLCLFFLKVTLKTNQKTFFF